MIGIIDPFTGRTFNHDSSLECLMEWTRQTPILRAMVSTGLADVQGLVKLAASVRLAMENNRAGLTEDQAVDVLLQMIESKPVRKAIVRHVAREHGVTLWQASRDMKALYMELASRLVPETMH